MIKTRTVTGPTARLVMTLVFAGALLVIQSVEFLVDSWRPEVGEPAPFSIRLPAFSVIRLHLGQPAEMVRERVVVQAGVPIMRDEDGRLVTAYEAMRREHVAGWSLGMFLVSVVACLLLLAELRRSPGSNQLLRAQATLLGLLLVFAAGAKAFLLLTGLPAYYFPMAGIVLISAFLFNRRIALAVNLFASTVFASLLGFDVAALVVVFITSYAGTVFLQERKKRRAMVIAGSLSGWFAALGLLVLMLVFDGAINITREVLFPDHSEVLGALVGGVFSGIVAFVLIEPVGWLVGRVSRNRLVDLQDLEHPVLKKIKEEAPGTWEHSRAAANLAEGATAAIGGDALLARVGAYMHDAGKALGPDYFIENQNSLGIENPHDHLAPDKSTKYIFEHVSDGVDLLRRHRVPEAIVEFSYTHHGTSLLEYFWVKNREEGNPKGLKERSFRYPGMKPRTRETGIMMIVDAVEAASRTIKEPTKEKFENLVQRIVFTKLSQGQLDDCGLSLSDLKKVTNTVVESLVNMYHGRIEYQWQRDSASTTDTGSRAVTQTGSTVVTQTGSHGNTTQTGPTTGTVDTGPQNNTVDTGPHNAAVDTGPHNAAVDTGPQSPAVDTGPQNAAVGTGPHNAALDTGARNAAIAAALPPQSSDVRVAPEAEAQIFSKRKDPPETPSAMFLAQRIEETLSEEAGGVLPLTKPTTPKNQQQPGTDLGLPQVSPPDTWKEPSEEGVVVRIAAPIGEGSDALSGMSDNPLDRPGTNPGIGGAPRQAPQRSTDPLPGIESNPRDEDGSLPGENSRTSLAADQRTEPQNVSPLPREPELDRKRKKPAASGGDQ